MNLSTKNGILNGNRMRLNGIKDWVLCINKEGHFCYYHIRKNQFYTCVSFTDLTRHDFEIWAGENDIKSANSIHKFNCEHRLTPLVHLGRDDAIFGRIGEIGIRSNESRLIRK